MRHISKITFLLFIICSIHNTISAQEVSSKVKQVTIYPYGAKVTRTTAITLEKGMTKLVLTDLEKNFDKNTIEINTDNDAIDLQGVRSFIKQNDNYQQNPRWIALEDSIKLLNQEELWLNEQKFIYEEEEKIINKNSQLSTSNSAPKISELKDLVQFYRAQLFDIRQKKLAVIRAIDASNQLERQLNNEKNKLAQRKSTYQVHADIYTPQNTTTNITFSYFVGNVSWKAVYDLKAKDTKSPMQLSYRAAVKQNTGVDWKDVKVTFSNAKPSKNKIQPTLAPLYATFITHGETDTVVTFDPDTYEEKVQVVRQDATHLKDEEQNVQELATSFLVKIEELQNIPSSSNTQFIKMQSVELETDYEYFCIPKKDPQVYLLAKLSNYGQYHLEKGMANLFFENTYIGQTLINPTTIADTLEISLGQDPNIVVERHYRDFTETKNVRSNTKETLYFDINIRNNKSESVTVKVLDQIPVSTNKDIEIKLLEHTNSEVCVDSGELEWHIVVPPHQSEKVDFSYMMKYPKDKMVGKK